MAEYRVCYEIDVDADDPKDAVAQAWKAMHKKGSRATIFEVCEVTYPDEEQEILTHLAYYEASTMREVIAGPLGAEYRDEEESPR